MTEETLKERQAAEDALLSGTSTVQFHIGRMCEDAAGRCFDPTDPATIKSIGITRISSPLGWDFSDALWPHRVVWARMTAAEIAVATRQERLRRMEPEFAAAQLKDDRRWADFDRAGHALPTVAAALQSLRNDRREAYSGDAVAYHKARRWKDERSRELASQNDIFADPLAPFDSERGMGNPALLVTPRVMRSRLLSAAESGGPKAEQARRGLELNIHDTMMGQAATLPPVVLPRASARPDPSLPSLANARLPAWSLAVQRSPDDRRRFREEAARLSDLILSLLQPPGATAPGPQGGAPRPPIVAAAPRPSGAGSGAVRRRPCRPPPTTAAVAFLQPPGMFPDSESVAGCGILPVRLATAADVGDGGATLADVLESDFSENVQRLASLQAARQPGATLAPGGDRPAVLQRPGVEDGADESES